jgi:phage-related protein
MNELFVKIGADFSELQKGLENAQDKINNFGKSTSNLGASLSKNLTAPILIVGGGLLGLAKKTGDYADRILDLNAITGMSTDSIQEWQHVTKIAGVDTESVTDATIKLNRQLFSLENGSGKASESFEKLGLNFEDFNQLSADDRIAILIDRLSRIENDADRARIGTELLGGAWQDIAPIVALGADEINKARLEANELGSVMGEDALNSANNFRIMMERLKTQVTNTGRELAMKFLPIVEKHLVPLIEDHLVPALEKLADFIDIGFKKFESLSDSNQKLVLGFIGVLAILGPVLIVVGKLISIFSLVLSPVGLVILAIAGITTAILYLYENNEDFANFVIVIWEKISKAFEILGSSFKYLIEGDLFSAFEEFEYLMQKIFGYSTEFSEKIYIVVENAIYKITEIIKTLGHMFQSVIKGDISNAIDDFETVLQIMFGYSSEFSEKINGALHTIKYNFRQVFEAIKNIIDTVLLPTLKKIIELFQNVYTQIQPILNDMLDFIGVVFGRILEFWNENGTQIVQAIINIVTFIANLFKKLFDDIIAIINFFLPFITGMFHVAWILIKDIFNSVLTIIMGLFKIFAGVFTGDWKKVWEGVQDVFAGIFLGVVNTFKGVINTMINYLNFFTSKLSSIKIKIPEVDIPLIGKVGGFEIGIPNIPKIPFLAEGGIVTSPTLAMIGEGGDEAVIPLNKLSELGGKQDIHIYLDGREITKSVAPQMVDMLRARGILA